MRRCQYCGSLMVKGLNKKYTCSELCLITLTEEERNKLKGKLSQNYLNKRHTTEE